MGYATVRVPRTGAALAVLLAPSLRLAAGQLSVFSSVSGALLFDRGVGARGTVAVSWLQPLRGNTALDAAITTDALDYPDFEATGAVTGQLRLQTGDERGNAYVSGVVTRARLGQLPRNGWRIETGGGFSRAHWSANILLSRAVYLDRLPEPAPVAGAEPVVFRTAFADVSGGIQATVPPGIVVDLTAGVRLDNPVPDDGLAASATITIPIVPGRVLLIAGAGRQWTDFVRGLPGGQFAYGSVRLAQLGTKRPPRPVLEAACVGPAPVLRARVHAASVEVQSDLTEWRSVAMLPVGDGMFEAVLAAPEGAARVLWRLDGGAWGPPPGLPITESEFGGRTGTIVLPKCRAPAP